MRVSRPTRALAIVLASLIWLIALSTAVSAKTQIKDQVPSALTLYKLSLKADELFSYSGKQFITVWRDDDRAFATATDVVHAAPRKELIVYTAPRSRNGRTILEDYDQQWTYVPQRKLLVHSVQQSEPASDQVEDFDLLLRNYGFNVQPKPVIVAGRKAFIVEIVPRSLGRAYEHIWIDPYTGVVLRREKFHSDGSEALISYFSEIHYNQMLTSQQFSPKRWMVSGIRQVDQTRPSEPALANGTLPVLFQGKAKAPSDLNGYTLESATILGSGHKSLHLVYSDGLNTLSVFERLRIGKSPTRLPASRTVSIGKGKIGNVLQTYSYSVLSWDTPQVNYTLIGDANLPTLIRLSQAI